jgi:poly-gamma-glutamate capsule biosynthesis protein CapA/YwtB (metallophosphatase superfamily)
MTRSRPASRPSRPVRTPAPRRAARTSILVASDWAPIRAFDEPMRTRPEALYGDLLPILSRADLRIVNLECALTGAGAPVWKSGAVFKGTPEHVRGLTVVPFDVACLANNHVLDYGVAGLRETMRVLARHNVQTVGAGLTEEDAHAPLTCQSHGSKVHIVNISEGEDLTASRGGPGVFGWDMDRAIATIRRCRKQGGIVIAIAHCGLEYVPYPPPYVVAAFRAMSDAGADAVIGHHPHVPQGIEWREGRLIIYSLGNFAFYQLTDLHYRKVGYFVVLHGEDNRIAGVDLFPYRITDTGLELLTGSADASFRRTLAALSTPFKTALGPGRAWQAYLAYYGMAGFTSEVQGILDRMKTEPQKAAAMFRNRLTTMQHSELWKECLTGIMSAQTPKYPAGAHRMVEEYFTSRICAPLTR